LWKAQRSVCELAKPRAGAAKFLSSGEKIFVATSANSPSHLGTNIYGHKYFSKFVNVEFVRTFTHRNDFFK